MKSCYTYILLGLFPNEFPVLRNLIESNSIWKECEAFFQSNDCEFNKQVIKAFHYASILGGGKHAYRESTKKLSKEGIHLSEEEINQYINTFTKHPVVKKMKSFINKWGYINAGKQIDYPNDESQTIKPPLQVIDPSTSKTKKDYTNSNTLQVFSDLLRAWEMVLISYIGLSHPEAFDKLLHQHDGRTHS